MAAYQGAFFVLCLAVLNCYDVSCCIKVFSIEHRAWGCRNQKPNLELSSTVSSTPIWGRKRYVVPLKYTDLSILESHLVKIQEILRRVIAKVNFNNVDSFIDFYNDVKSLNFTSQSKFRVSFEDYRPSVKQISQYENLTIEVFKAIEEELVPSIPGLERSMCLVAGVADVPKIYVKKLNNPHKRISDLPVNYFDRVLGAIKFFHRRSCTERRNGIILLHPGAGISVPIVIMEDGLPPHNAYAPYGEENKLNFNYLPWSEKFVLSTPASFKGKKDADDWLGGVNYVDTLVYTLKGYCSVLDTTSKYDLISIDKIEQKRNEAGIMLASYEFPIMAQESLFEESFLPYFRLTYRDENTEEIRKLKVSFRSLKHANFQVLERSITGQHQEDYIEIFSKVSKILGYRKDVLLKKLQKVGEILNDEQFLNNVRSVRSTTSKIRPKQN